LPLPSSSRPALVVVVFIRRGRGCHLFVFIVRHCAFVVRCRVVCRPVGLVDPSLCCRRDRHCCVVSPSSGAGPGAGSLSSSSESSSLGLGSLSSSRRSVSLLCVSRVVVRRVTHIIVTGPGNAVTRSGHPSRSPQHRLPRRRNNRNRSQQIGPHIKTSQLHWMLTTTITGTIDNGNSHSKLDFNSNPSTPFRVASHSKTTTTATTQSTTSDDHQIP
jgi:hypothetical protein